MTELLPEVVVDIRVNPGLTPSPNNFVVLGNQAFFIANNGTNGYELWVTDGTTPGTRLVKDINPGTNDGLRRYESFNSEVITRSVTANLVAYNGKVYFGANNGVNGFELWATDGTEAGTQLVTDIRPGANSAGTPLSANPGNFVVYNGKLYFTAYDDTHGRELWVTDGTAGGTQLVKDIYPNANNSDANGFTVYDGKLYFSASEPNTASELWVTDGTTAGTQLIKDITPGGFLLGSSSPRDFTIFNGKLYFSATEWQRTGRELWVTDGTAAGTQLFKDINTQSVSGYTDDANPANLTVIGNQLFFTARDATTGTELWVTDGTVAGTRLVKDIAPGVGGSSPQNFIVFNGKVFFSATDSLNGREVWFSDGTEAGTQLLKVITPSTGLTDPNPIQFAVFDGKLYISINDGTVGRELWVSDGTTAGTRLLADIVPGGSSSSPTNFMVLGNQLLFMGTGVVAGTNTSVYRLWKLDPNTPNVAIAPDNADQAEGNAGATPFTFTVTRTGNLSVASSVNYAVTGSGTSPANRFDFAGSAFPTGTVDFAPNQATATVTLNVNGDTTIEPDETFTVTLISATGATIPVATNAAIGTIRNDDFPATPTPNLAITATDANKAEGNSGTTAFTFTLTRSGNGLATPSSVEYAVTGDGSNPADADDFGGTLPTGIVNFAANQTTATVTINVSGDIATEADEGFRVTLSNPTNAILTTTSALGTIRNDDTEPSITIVATNADQPEGNSGTTPFTFTLTRSGNLSAASSVQYAVTSSGATAADDADFGGTLPTGTIDFAANQATAILTINVSGDSEIELDEDFTVVLSNPTNAILTTASATGTIRNDDAAPGTPTVTIVATNADQPEGNSGTTPFTFTVTRSGGDISNPSAVQYAVTGEGSNPADPADFGGIFPTGLVDFAANQTTATVTVNVSGDTDDEGDETFRVTLSNALNALITTGSAIGTIRNDDAPSTPPTPTPAPLLTVNASNTFTVGGTGDLLPLLISLAQTNTNRVNEIGLFKVDDAEGGVNGIAVGANGYVAAALDRAKVVFSALANRPNGFGGDLQRILDLAPGDRFRFYLVQNGTTDGVLTGKISNDRVTFSTVEIVSQGNNAFTVNWEDGTGANNFQDVVITVQPSTQSAPIGTGLQGNPQAELFDLRPFQGQQIRAEFSVYREAAFDNFVGFYRVNDAQGRVTDPLTGGTIAPGQAGYIQAALRARIQGVDLTVANQATTTLNNQFAGGSILAPFIIANGRPEALLDTNTSNDPAIYFPFIGANSDGVDHIRLLGDNTFGFEDLPGGGDADYNDIVVRVRLTV